MSNRNSQIIIAKNIKLDKTYKNVLSYNDTNMLTYVNANSVGSRNTYSFIRERDSILADFSYSDAIKCNYMAYQNPDFSNKWFFAFIDNVKYKNDSTVEIFFTIDVWSTWFSKMNFNECFVIREHVNNDVTGVHTIPEGLETGPYMCNSHTLDETLNDVTSDLTYILSMAGNIYTTISDKRYAPSGINKYNGIYSGTTYYRFDDAEELTDVLNQVAEYGQSDIINGLFMAPKTLATTPITSGYKSISQSDSSKTYTLTVPKQTSLGGYVPVNKKLLCYPYNYLMVTNGNGQTYTYNYEDFSGNDTSFKVSMAITPGCSINMIPTNYKGISEGDDYSIMMGKLPICSYPVDMYTNWLTQNSVNIAGKSFSVDDVNDYSTAISGVGGMMGSAMSGNVGGLVTGFANNGVNIINNMMSRQQHEKIPPQTGGNLNNGDVLTASSKNTFHFYKMSIKPEYARCIDDFFTAKGYTVNRLKVPNITGRSNFNYIQIDNESNLCYGEIPTEYMNLINQIARNGVTIWHNHSNILNYDVSNSVVS